MENRKISQGKKKCESEKSEKGSEEESETDSFKSDSDFEDLDDDAAYYSGRGGDEGEPRKGFIEKSPFGKLYKRYSRKFWKTNFGKKVRRGKNRF